MEATSKKRRLISKQQHYQKLSTRSFLIWIGIRTWTCTSSVEAVNSPYPVRCYGTTCIQMMGREISQAFRYSHFIPVVHAYVQPMWTRMVTWIFLLAEELSPAGIRNLRRLIS